MAAYEDALAALAEPTRRIIYERVVARPQTVTELVRGLTISQPAVSQHLRVLKRAQLVRATPHGNRRVYSADPAALVALRAWVDGLWADVLGAFAAHIAGARDDTGSPR